MSDPPVIRIGDGSGNESYRACPECGRDCEPEPIDAGPGKGMRIAFECPDHGVHSLIDPFADDRL